MFIYARELKKGQFYFTDTALTLYRNPDDDEPIENVFIWNDFFMVTVEPKAVIPRIQVIYEDIVGWIKPNYLTSKFFELEESHEFLVPTHKRPGR